MLDLKKLASIVFRTLLKLMVSLSFTTMLHAERHALLVGVSTYPALKENQQSRGPQPTFCKKPNHKV